MDHEDRAQGRLIAEAEQARKKVQVLCSGFGGGRLASFMGFSTRMVLEEAEMAPIDPLWLNTVVPRDLSLCFREANVHKNQVGTRESGGEP